MRTMTIGNAADAASACLGHDDYDKHDTALIELQIYEGIEPKLSDWHKRCIGSGERRTAWLINGVVYKVGSQSSNRYEHEVLTAWREAGAHWAPRTSLHEVGISHFGAVETVVVVAMEYIPDDRSEGNPEDLAEIRRVAPQTCPENWHTMDGRTYLIDGEDIECLPSAANRERPEEKP